MFTSLFEAAGTLFNWMLRFVLLHIEAPSVPKWEIYLFVERRAYKILRILQIKLRESGKEQDIEKKTHNNLPYYFGWQHTGKHFLNEFYHQSFSAGARFCAILYIQSLMAGRREQSSRGFTAETSWKEVR